MLAPALTVSAISRTLAGLRPPGRRAWFTSASFTEAHSVRSLLEGNEIDAVVLDDHLIAQNPVHYGGALGFIKVAVPEDQVPKVKDVFKERPIV